MTKVVEYGAYRYYLSPNSMDWCYQHKSQPLKKEVDFRDRSISYDFARNPFDHLLWSVTNRCNITCDYCFRGYNMKKTDELNYDDFLTIADHFEANAQHKPTFQFTGGEVFVKEGIEKWFANLDEREFRIWMTTNGVSQKISSDPTIRRVFTDNQRVHVRVSCDGHNSDLYERHRGKRGTFQRVEQNLKHLVDMGVQTSIKSVITPENFPYIEEILDWAHELGLYGWNYNVLRYTGAMAAHPPADATAKRKGAIPYISYVQIGRKLVEILNRKPHLGHLLGISRFGKILDTLYGSKPHGVRMQYYMLNFDGKVYSNDNLMEEEYMCGDFRKEGIAAFKGLDTRYGELDIDLPGCKKCTIHKFCQQKGDYGELYNQDSSLTDEFPNCGDIRHHFFDILSLREKGPEMLRLLNPKHKTEPV